MTLFYKSFTILVCTRLALSTISGLTYMEAIRQRPLDSKLPGEDPCNPLYWYPKTIPEYCYFKPPVTIVTEKPPLPVPLPVPVPLPIPVPLPNPVPVPVPLPLPSPVPLPIPVPLSVPVPLSSPMAPPILMPVPQHFPGQPMPLPIMPPPPPIVSPPAIPIAFPPLYGQSPLVPYAPADPLMAYGTNLQSHFPFPYPIREPQTGLMPGLPGLVTDDGGINIMPFSDVYADILEKHKNKMIRKKLRRIIKEYEHFPNSRKYSRHKKFNRMADLY